MTFHASPEKKKSRMTFKESQFPHQEIHLNFKFKVKSNSATLFN